MRELELIRRLADGAFHSGEELGAALSLSRAAIWKRVGALTRLGLDVERVRGKGYRLCGGLPLLDPVLIRQAGGLAADEIDIRVVPVTGSTNADAIQALRGPLPRPRALLAEMQTAGRGRRGRSWVAPFGSSLLLSMVVEFPGGAGRLDGLSLAAGIAVAEVLHDAGLGAAGLKWPNDILVGERKLGGILIELAGDLDSACRAVIGIGLNCTVSPRAMQGVDQLWTDIAGETGSRPDRNRLAGQLLRHLLAMSDEFRREGFAPFLPRWEALDLLRDTAVHVLQGETFEAGVARGVTRQGALLLEAGGELREYHGGEVSLRRASA